MTADNIALDRLIEELTCDICLILFNDKGNIPKSLSCGHTLCLDCLQNILDRSSNKACPKCRIPLTATINDYKRNYSLLQVASLFTQNDEKKISELQAKYLAAKRKIDELDLEKDLNTIKDNLRKLDAIQHYRQDLKTTILRQVSDDFEMLKSFNRQYLLDSIEEPTSDGKDLMKEVDSFKNCMSDSRALVTVILPRNIQKDIICKLYDKSSALLFSNFISNNGNGPVYFESAPNENFTSEQNVSLLQKKSSNNQIFCHEKTYQLFVLHMSCNNRVHFIQGANVEKSYFLQTKHEFTLKTPAAPLIFPFKKELILSKNLLTPTLGYIENNDEIYRILGAPNTLPTNTDLCPGYQCFVSQLIPVIPDTAE